MTALFARHRCLPYGLRRCLYPWPALPQRGTAPPPLPSRRRTIHPPMTVNPEEWRGAAGATDALRRAGVCRGREETCPEASWDGCWAEAAEDRGQDGGGPGSPGA